MLGTAFNIASVVAQPTLLVDQSQTLYNIWAMIYNNGHAQSFVPSHNMLSRVDVLLQLGSGVLDYVKFKIFQDDGTGFPDTSVVLASAELVPGPDVIWDGFEYTGWYIADFADIEVNVGQRYYIWVDIIYGSPEWKGKWGVADGHGDPAYHDLYPRGEAWTFVYVLPTPSKDPTNDFTFKTYYSHIPVGGKATPINMPMNSPESMVPYIGLIILLAVAATTVVYAKKRKRDAEIIS